MLVLSSSLAARVASRHGVVTADELVTDGVTISTIRRAVTAGVLLRCHAGVYRLATSSYTFEARCVAVCLADADAFITGVAAGRLWGFRHIPQRELPIVSVPHARHPFANGVTVRRTNVIDAEDWIVRADGIRVASPARAWFDAARDLDDQRFEALTEWVLDQHTSVPTLWRTRRRLATSGRVGAARVNRVLSQREVWQKPADSMLELRVFKALERHGVSGLVRQQPIRLPDGTVIHADLALPAIRWAVEVDHVTWHGGRLDAQRDKGRDRNLRRVGWEVDRVTDVELSAAFDATIRELIDLIGQRRRSVAA